MLIVSMQIFKQETDIAFLKLILIVGEFSSNLIFSVTQKTVVIADKRFPVRR